MIKNTARAAIWVICMAIVAAVSWAFAEETLSPGQVPEAVLKTIEKHADGGKIVEIERENEHGQVVYEAEVVRNGKEFDIVVSPTGEFLGTETEEDEDDDDNEITEDNEQSVQWEQLPAAVQTALANTLPGVQIDELTVETEHGTTYYEACYTAEGTEHEMKLTENGYIVESEQQIPSAELPTGVLRALEIQFPNAEIEEAEVVQLTFYEVELELGGKEYEVRVLANGKVLGTEDED